MRQGIREMAEEMLKADDESKLRFLPSAFCLLPFAFCRLPSPSLGPSEQSRVDGRQDVELDDLQLDQPVLSRKLAICIGTSTPAIFR